MSARARSADRERPFLFDPDSPEYIKDLQRPAVIKEDLTEMERRKRVQEILESKSFLKELEHVIKQETQVAKSDPEHLKMVHRLAELAAPTGATSLANLHVGNGANFPIADLRNTSSISRQEKLLRNKLSSLYRLVDLFQWSQGIYNHITVRLPGASDEILVNPFGLLYHEISASSLLKVNDVGEVLDQGATKLGINKSTFGLHAAIHSARSDIVCVLHLHTAVVAAVASMSCGLLPLCQEAMVIGPVAYHDYQGILSEEEEKENIVNSLGNHNVMLLYNRGFVVCGRTVEEALHLAFHTVRACETQIVICRGNGYFVVGNSLEEAAWISKNLIWACDQQIRAAKAGIENLVLPKKEAIEKTYRLARASRNGSTKEDEVNWNVGELEWEAWMRVLDNAGLRTGHIYRQPLLRPKSQMSQSMYCASDVAEPPSATSMGLIDECDPESVISHKLALLRKEQDRSRWLNSPNAYQKIEILETGTDRPKRITKWVQDATSLSANSTPIKINSVHQFSPMTGDNKEFKDKQKKLKEYRRTGCTSAGPQSQIFDGITYEEISHIKPDNEGLIGQSDRSILIGTASKGIIDRQHQHNAQVYRQLYAPNPFAAETDAEIKKYIEEVELKSPKSRTPCSARDTTYDSTRSPIPYDEDTGADTASLMQGVRQHREATQGDTARTSTSMDGLDVTSGIGALSPRSATVDTSRTSRTESGLDDSELMVIPEPRATSTPKGDFKRSKSKSDRTSSKRLFGSSGTSTRSKEVLSEDELGRDEKKKKKKKGLFSFMKRKDRHPES